MVTIGLGTGGIKANVTPMCAEQYEHSRPMLRTLKSGEEVIVDPELTVQRLFMWLVIRGLLSFWSIAKYHAGSIGLLTLELYRLLSQSTSRLIILSGWHT
jgi:dipeptide/tripeptide permease